MMMEKPYQAVWVPVLGAVRDFAYDGKWIELPCGQDELERVAGELGYDSPDMARVRETDFWPGSPLAALGYDPLVKFGSESLTEAATVADIADRRLDRADIERIETVIDAQGVYDGGWKACANLAMQASLLSGGDAGWENGSTEAAIGGSVVDAGVLDRSELERFFDFEAYGNAALTEMLIDSRGVELVDCGDGIGLSDHFLDGPIEQIEDADVEFTPAEIAAIRQDLVNHWGLDGGCVDVAPDIQVAAAMTVLDFIDPDPDLDDKVHAWGELIGGYTLPEGVDLIARAPQIEICRHGSNDPTVIGYHVAGGLTGIADMPMGELLDNLDYRAIGRAAIDGQLENICASERSRTWVMGADDIDYELYSGDELVAQAGLGGADAPEAGVAAPGRVDTDRAREDADRAEAR